MHVRHTLLSDIHPAPVRHLLFMKHMHYVASCCNSERVSMVIYDLRNKVKRYIWNIHKVRSSYIRNNAHVY